MIRQVLGVLAASLLASAALAQSPTTDWNGLPDRFQIDAGYYRITPETVLRYNGGQGSSGDIDFENNLGLQRQSNTYWIDGTWRIGRRHTLKLAFTRISRAQDGVTLQRDFVWGGQEYSAGLTARASTSSDIFAGYYRFAAFRNARFEIGPTVGIGHLQLNAGIEATGTVNTPAGSTSRTLDQSASTGSITGAIGAYTSGWLAKRLVVSGDFLYIKVSPGESDASVVDWRMGADYYFLKNVGLGVQYKYDRYRYDRGILVAKLGGEVTYKGFQIFGTFRF